MTIPFPLRVMGMIFKKLHFYLSFTWVHLLCAYTSIHDMFCIDIISLIRNWCACPNYCPPVMRGHNDYCRTVLWWFIFILLNTGNGSITDIQFNNIDYCYVHNKDTNWLLVLSPPTWMIIINLIDKQKLFYAFDFSD